MPRAARRSGIDAHKNDENQFVCKWSGILVSPLILLDDLLSHYLALARVRVLVLVFRTPFSTENMI